MMDRAVFSRQVQDALAHLYDHVYLQQHRLAELLAAGPHAAARGRTLHRTLLEAVGQLKPPQDAPQLSVAWRRYRYFFLRYVEGWSAMDAAEEVAISERQSRRYHQEALEAVISTLWGMYCRSSRAALPGRASAPQEAVDESPGEWHSILEEEVARLDHESDTIPVALPDVLATVHSTVANLARSKGVSVQLSLPHNLSLVALDRVQLRQILFGVLTYAIHQGAPGAVIVRASNHGAHTSVEIDIVTANRTHRLPGDGLPSAFDVNHLEPARQLLAGAHGALELLHQEEDRMQLRLLLPAIQQRTMLVVDDNPEILQLFQRFLSGRPYQVITANSGTQAIELARRARPQLITLDLMMPTQDGWELLQLLKNLPETREIPVVVCSVLRERELALSLGAADFLAKPVTQQALLVSLDRCRSA